MSNSQRAAKPACEDAAGSSAQTTGGSQPASTEVPTVQVGAVGPKPDPRRVPAARDSQPDGANAVTEQVAMVEPSRQATHGLVELLPDLLAPGMPTELLVGLGEVYYGLGEQRCAQRCFERASTQSPNNADAVNNLGVVRFSADDPDMAEQLFLQALRCQPDHEQARNNLLDLHAAVPRLMARYWGQDVATAKRIVPSDASVSIALPPPELRFMNETDDSFHEIGARNLETLRYHGLSGATRLLDVGSGYGRLPIAMLRGMDFHGRYVGMDILPRHVRWCRDNIAARHEHLEFHHMDVRNGRYNPAGRFHADSYHFPFAERSFDMSCLFSVFTHMYEHDIENYLNELHRVLMPGGTVVATFFLLTPQRLGGTEADAVARTMGYELNENTRYRDPNDKLHAIGYDMNFMTHLIETAGFALSDVVLGHWAGGSGDTYQDRLVFSKH